jgi:hypothetical protein
MIDANAIETMKRMLRDMLLESWTAQGHYESGAVVETIEYTIEKIIDTTSLVAYMAPYGVYIETGTPASNIPFSPGSGASNSRYIEALMNYASRRMNANSLKEARSAAFAIAHKQKKEGMPTRNSLSFSSTGRRTGWIDAALEKGGEQLGAFIRDHVKWYFETQFDNIISKHKQNI